VFREHLAQGQGCALVEEDLHLGRG
jgi:hypothetical protein